MTSDPTRAAGSNDSTAGRRCASCHATYTGTERFCPIDGGAIVSPTSDDPRIGRTIDGRYLIRRAIGRGGMGAVYEADHVGLDRRVAVKFVLQDRGADPDALARFRREARVASRIQHEHVVQIFDVGTDGDDQYIAMEYVDGRDLREVLQAERFLPVARAVEITRQVLRGLQAIHDVGILHRDLKPSNIVITRSDVAKIMDFGISVAAGPEMGAITQTGKLIGTPQYMAPEVLFGDRADERTDVYAIGLVLYEMLVGTLPDSETSVARLAAARVGAPRASISELLPDLPRALVSIVECALAGAPAARFASADAFREELDTLQTGELRRSQSTAPVRSRDRVGAAGLGEPTLRDTPSARTANRPRPAARRLVILAGVAIAAVGLGVVVWQTTRTSSETRVASIADANGPALTPEVVAPAPTPVPVDASVLVPVVAAVKTSESSRKVQRIPGRPTTPSSSRAPKTRAEACLCILRLADGTTTGGCRQLARQPVCSCEHSDRGGLCRVPYIEENHFFRCASYQFTGVKEGNSCTGHDTNGAELAGVVWCNRCARETYSFAGADGDPCTGFAKYGGESASGTLRRCGQLSENDWK